MKNEKNYVCSHFIKKFLMSIIIAFHLKSKILQHHWKIDNALLCVFILNDSNDFINNPSSSFCHLFSSRHLLPHLSIMCIQFNHLK